MNETYIDVKGKWKYYYLAADKFDNVNNSLLCEHSDEKVARTCFNKDINHNGLPRKVVIDRSCTNLLALHNINIQLCFTGRMLNVIEMLQVKYLNNLLEQSYRKVKVKCISA
ncbi:DDE-type integrase/transposase/recombinase [Candidatus Enterovibrio escicola]|nr:DDE-type integrase/transposase/recombinase [Candidatus Enterovibrio escacola]